jgi:hypothetical protein
LIQALKNKLLVALLGTPLGKGLLGLVQSSAGGSQLVGLSQGFDDDRQPVLVRVSFVVDLLQRV